MSKEKTMTYVKNNYPYAISYSLGDGLEERKFEFDCERRYQDTGNIATTGVTPILEEDYDALYGGCPQFKQAIDAGKLEKRSEDGALSVSNQIDALQKENDLLKEQLAKKTKEASTATSDEMKSLADENASLKEQLEALKKQQAEAGADADAESGDSQDAGKNEGF